tara:strand:+ start:149 stop:517 length:369 start_codon:yes stop_codon:yes gene_type:complete
MKKYFPKCEKKKIVVFSYHNYILFSSFFLFPLLFSFFFLSVTFRFRIYDSDTDPDAGGMVKQYTYSSVFNFTHTTETFCIFVSNMGAQIKLEFSMTHGEDEFPHMASLMCGALDAYSHHART